MRKGRFRDLINFIPFVPSLVPFFRLKCQQHQKHRQFTSRRRRHHHFHPFFGCSEKERKLFDLIPAAYFPLLANVLDAVVAVIC